MADWMQSAARSHQQEVKIEETKKKLDHESLLSVENNSGVPFRQVIEVKDNWVNIRATMDTGAAGHVMPAEMFPRVKLDRTSTTKKFVAANGERIKDLGVRTIPFKSVEGVHRCIKLRSASVVKPLILMGKVMQAGNFVVLDEKNPHIRNNRDGTVIKLDVNNGVYTMDMWEMTSVTNEPTRPGAKCSRGGEECHQTKSWNGLAEGEDATTDEEGEGVGGEVEAGTADWRVRAGPRERDTKQHSCRSAIGAR